MTNAEYIEALCQENEYMKNINADLWRKIDELAKTIADLNLEIDRLTKLCFERD